MSWEDKAHRLIALLCRASYKQANARPRKKHRPYSVPETAQELIACLDTRDEKRAKAIFLSYEGLLAIKNDPVWP